MTAIDSGFDERWQGNHGWPGIPQKLQANIYEIALVAPLDCLDVDLDCGPENPLLC